jgi:hypothetical protein
VDTGLIVGGVVEPRAGLLRGLEVADDDGPARFDGGDVGSAASLFWMAGAASLFSKASLIPLTEPIEVGGAAGERGGGVLGSEGCLDGEGAPPAPPAPPALPPSTAAFKTTSPFGDVTAGGCFAKVTPPPSPFPADPLTAPAPPTPNPADSTP